MGLPCEIGSTVAMVEYVARVGRMGKGMKGSVAKLTSKDGELVVRLVFSVKDYVAPNVRQVPE